MFLVPRRKENIEKAAKKVEAEKKAEDRSRGRTHNLGSLGFIIRFTVANFLVLAALPCKR
jgi:hypothetical protein